MRKIVETREEKEWEREGYRPDAEVERLLGEINELPVGGQIAVLRALAVRVLLEMHPDERMQFLDEIRARVAPAG